MIDAEVIVAGAGPAGAAAALVLAGAGRSVLVLDRAAFPRDKLCAGLLTWKTLRTIGRLTGETERSLIAKGLVNHVSRRYRIRHRDRVIAEGELVYPFHFVARRVFDAWLVERVRAAGADVLEGERVVRAWPETATVRAASGREFRGRFLLGADGAGSRVRRAFSQAPETWRAEMGLGLEVFLDRVRLAGMTGLHEDVTADFPTIYSGFLPAGYAWVFPHKERVIAGIGGLPRSGGEEGFARAMREFLAFLGLEADLPVRGHPLPYGNWLTRPFQGGTLLVGDAAGLVEPFFGEGIHYALHSGELAGLALTDALAHGREPAAAYLAGLERDIYPELIYSKRLRRVLYWFVRNGVIGPLRLFLRGGGTRLQEMVHGMRSFRFLRKLG